MPRASRFLKWILAGGITSLGVGVPIALTSCASTGTRQIQGYRLPRKPEAAGELTLLSWNIHKAKDPDLPLDLKLALVDHRPELVFLQEATPYMEGVPHLAGVLAPAWHTPLKTRSGAGVFTASAYHTEDPRALVTRGRELGFTLPKVSLATRHTLSDGRELLAINIHALNFEHGTPNRFMRQLGELRALMNDHEGPIVFAGDFNTWNDQRDDHLRALANDLGLTEVEGFTRARKTGDQGWANGLLGVDPDLPLDRVFYRGLEVSKAEVLALDSSDHPPLLVSFTYL